MSKVQVHMSRTTIVRVSFRIKMDHEFIKLRLEQHQSFE